MTKNRAFTLIELLVVIAIIAILAAILFPVFAQAKLAAKGAADLSNAKQNALGILMYSGDYDDVVPTDTNWNTGSDPLTFGDGLAFSTWAFMIQPYLKNGEILADPTGPGTPTFWNSRVLTLTSYPGFGYNYVYMAPWGPNPLVQSPISTTKPAQPADTVMFSNRGSYSDGDGYFWGFDFTPWTTTSPLLNVAVEVPNCYTIAQYCADNWGVGGFADGVNAGNVAGGANTGGVALHAQDSSVVAFMDGHVKKMKPGALAAGTNWTTTSVPGDLVVTDITKYLWDTD